MRNYRSKTSFEIVRIGDGKKPIRSEGEILWPREKKYGEVSIKNPQGSDYKGIIESVPQQKDVYKGFVTNDQSAYSIFLYTRNIREGSVYLKPLIKDEPESRGVLIDSINYDRVYLPQPNK